MSFGKNSIRSGALALVGWYLLLPPTGVKPLQYQTGDLPALSKWAQVGAYDSASACREAHLQLPDSFKNPDQETAQRMLMARCIEADDPRLAK